MYLFARTAADEGTGGNRIKRIIPRDKENVPQKDGV